MKIVGFYTRENHNAYLKMKNHLSLCIQGVAVDVEYFVDSPEMQSFISQKYKVKTLPSFIVVDALGNVISKVACGSARELEELAVSSNKRLKL